MWLRYPEYYERFTCIAGKCEDTCCAGWEIDIDDESYEYYMHLSGSFGERVREHIKDYCFEDDSVYEHHGFVLKEGRRCPFLNQDNLCDMILELGESSLCYVCTHTPRNYFEYHDTREITISPGCPEAGRLIFSEKEPVRFLEKEIAEPFGWQETEEEKSMAEIIRLARDASVFLLQQRKQEGKRISVTARLRAFLRFSHQVQEYLNQGDRDAVRTYAEKVLEGKETFFADRDVLEDTADPDPEYGKKLYQFFCRRMKLFSELDSINEEWEQALERLWLLFMEEPSEKRYIETLEELETYIIDKNREYEYEQLLVYYAFLMLPRALDDDNFWGKTQFAAVSFLMIRDLDMESFFRNIKEFSKEDRLFNVRIYAKEVEHSEENLELLEEEFLFEKDYQLENLLFLTHDFVEK